MPAECVKYWLFFGNYEFFVGDDYLDTDKMITMGLNLAGETEHSSSTSVSYTISDQTSRLYMVWMDDMNRYHVIHEHNPFK